MKGGIHPSVMGKHSIYSCVKCHKAVDISYCCPRCRLIPYCGEKCMMEDRECHSQWCKEAPTASDMVPSHCKVLILDLKKTVQYNHCRGVVLKKDKDRHFVVLDGFRPTKVIKVRRQNFKIIKFKRPTLKNAEELWTKIHELDEIRKAKEKRIERETFIPGRYVITHDDGVIVRESVSMESDISRELKMGKPINIIKVKKDIVANRFRGQLEEGDWISIAEIKDIEEKNNPYRWVSPYDDKRDGRDDMISELVELADKYKSKIWKAYSLLAQCKLRDGKAYYYGLQAVYLMKEIGDVRGEAIALATISMHCIEKVRHYEKAFSQGAFMNMYICESLKNQKQQEAIKTLKAQKENNTNNQDENNANDEDKTKTENDKEAVRNEELLPLGTDDIDDHKEKEKDKPQKPQILQDVYRQDQMKLPEPEVSTDESVTEEEEAHIDRVAERSVQPELAKQTSRRKGCLRTTGSVLLNILSRIFVCAIIVGIALYIDGYFTREQGPIKSSENLWSQHEEEILACLMNDNIDNEVCADIALKAVA